MLSGRWTKLTEDSSIGLKKPAWLQKNANKPGVKYLENYPYTPANEQFRCEWMTRGINFQGSPIFSPIAMGRASGRGRSPTVSLAIRFALNDVSAQRATMFSKEEEQLHV